MGSWIESPVLITGLHKTGTTLIKDLLDGHPQLIVYPSEPRFLELYHQKYKDKEELLIRWRLEVPNPLHEVSENIKAIIEKEKDYINHPLIKENLWNLNIGGKIEGDKDGNISKNFSFPTYHSTINEYLKNNFYSFRDIMLAAIKGIVAALKLDSQKLRMWAFKDVLSGDIEWFFKMFLNGKAIFIIRDPRAFYLSFTSSNNTRGKNSFLDIIKLAQSYKERTRHLLYLANKYGKRIKIIFYEELVGNTSKIMKELSNFLQIEYSSILEQPTRFGFPIKVSTSTTEKGDSVYKDSIERWKKVLSRKEKLIIDFTLGELYSFLPYISQINPTLTKITGELINILFYISKIRKKLQQKNLSIPK